MFQLSHHDQYHAGQHGPAAVDQATYKRALPVPLIIIPGDYAYNEDPAIIQGWLTSYEGFPWTGQTGMDFWHALRNFPQLTYFVMTDHQTGQSMHVFPWTVSGLHDLHKDIDSGRPH